MNGELKLVSKNAKEPTNEDLITVNQELQERNEELNQSRQFAEAIIAILHEPLLFLEKDFTIKDANEAFYETFEINQQETIGKNLFALQSNGLNIPDLQMEINKVLAGGLKTAEIEINFTFPKIGNRTICFNIKTIKQENGEPLILLALDDITARKKAEELLVENTKIVSKERQLLHGFLMGAPAMFAILKGPDHIYEFANTQYIKYANRDVVGKKIIEAIPEIEGREFLHNLDHVYQTGESYTGTEILGFLEQEDGTLKQVFVDVNFQALKDENGNVEGVLVFAYDVTELIQNRKHIKRNAEMIENMYRHSTAYMATMTGLDYIYTFANESYEKVVGRKNLIGKKLFDALPELAGQGIKEILDNVYITGEIFLANEMPIRVAYEEGLEPVERYFNFSYQPIYDENNKITGILVFGYEATDQIMARKLRQEIAEKFHIISNSLPQKMNTTDADGNVDYYNQQWFDYTKLTFEEMIEAGWGKIIHPDDLKIRDEKWKHSISTGEEFQFEQRFLRYDGTYRWHLSRGVPQKDVNDKIVAWIGVHTDIEEQKVKEHQKDEFISIASHEMKTPLTSAKAYLQLVEMTLDENHDAYLYVQKASDAVERLNRLISELLDASKIQHGKLNYNNSAFDFDRMVNDTIENVQYSSSTHKIIKKGTIEKQFLGDKDRLQQVIINLLTNAIKYSPNANEVIVEVQQENNHLQVSVTDKGIGMSEKHLERVFERYYRIEEHSVQFQGLGIGLYISYDIIIRHNGKMWVESSLDEGSTFHFTLPFLN